ncbi:MAG: hypothetical protein ACTSXS_06240 [Candidatus Thorarchaeota archaeon]
MEFRTMETEHVQNVLKSLMIISFLIFIGLSGIIVITDVGLTTRTVALPFAFLFISAITLIITGRIEDHPVQVKSHLRSWLFLCIFAVLLAALAFTFTIA